MSILITGGNGFIGSHIAEYFTGRGETILRPSSRELNILNPAALAEALGNRGIQAVIHNAAKASDWGKERDFVQANVRGTLNVLEACREKGVRQIIMTGSCSVFGEEDCRRAKDEGSPRNSHYPYFLDRVFPCAMNYYRDSKKEGVEKAAAFAGRYGMNLTVIHPVWVYGEREFHTGFYEYLKTVKSGLPLIMGSRRNMFHVIYAGDLAKAYYLAYKAFHCPGAAEKNGGPSGQVREYIAGNPEPAAMEDVYRAFCAAADFKKPANLPKALLYPAAFLAELGAVLARGKEPPLLTRGRINMFYDSIAYSTEKIRRELGFTCDYSLEEGVGKTVNWYKENGYL